MNRRLLLSTAAIAAAAPILAGTRESGVVLAAEAERRPSSRRDYGLLLKDVKGDADIRKHRDHYRHRDDDDEDFFFKGDILVEKFRYRGQLFVKGKIKGSIFKKDRGRYGDKVVLTFDWQDFKTYASLTARDDWGRGDDWDGGKSCDDLALDIGEIKLDLYGFKVTIDPDRVKLDDIKSFGCSVKDLKDLLCELADLLDKDDHDDNDHYGRDDRRHDDKRDIKDVIDDINDLLKHCLFVVFVRDRHW
jgi:hypothetical protein